jgi:hypothetical protein
VKNREYWIPRDSVIYAHHVVLRRYGSLQSATGLRQMCNVHTNADWSSEKWNSVCSIVTSLRVGILENPVSIPGWINRFFSSPKHPDHLCSPRLLCNGYGGGREAFIRGKAAGALRLTVHLHLLPKIRLCGDTTPLAHTPSQRAQVQIYLLLYFTLVERVNVNWIKLALYCIHCQSVSLSVSQIMRIAANPSLRWGGRNSSVSVSYFFRWRAVTPIK